MRADLEQPCRMRYSTVIVNWNTRDLVLQCVGSLLKYCQPELNQIIVVDNASEDDSVAALRRNFPEVEVIASKENLGFSRGNNVGLRLARGCYICLVNSDIEVFDDVLARLGSYMDLHPEIGVLAPRLLNSDRTIQQGCWHFPTPLRSLAFSLGLHRLFPGVRALEVAPSLEGLHPRTVDTACGAFWMVRRKALEEVGLLDESFWFYAEDVDWCRRFRNAGWKVVYSPQSQVVHYGGASSSKAPVKYAVQMTRARLQVWRKYYGPATYSFLWLTKVLEHCVRAALFGLISIMNLAKSDDRHKCRQHRACVAWLLTKRALF